MLLLLSLVAFGIFALNVVLGSTVQILFLSDVGEMLLLLAAAILFVAAILNKEAVHKKNKAG